MKKFKTQKIVSFMMIQCPYKKWDVVYFGGYNGIIIKVRSAVYESSQIFIYTGKLNSRFQFYLLGVKVFFWNLIGKI